jgi:hypothetical protein
MDSAAPPDSPGRWRRRTVLGAAGAPLGGAAFGIQAWWARPPAAPLGDAIGAGASLGRWTVVAVHPIHHGAVPVVLATADGRRYQVDVLARDPAGPQGVANTEQLSLFVANHGDGRTSTDEEQGLGAMALAVVLLQERSTRHPQGAFGVPLS